ncbi:DJ-1/PfpI family protein [Treponema rectale]|uniref:4-methyl-5(B-hydroxyethyl)-thiazole monophosphate biosynthesis n=1 Tax=Treponema rectale TaxID=744512 RepID=A0A840SGL9_9SPIR|nr:DJ-1 family glyoxalase III [Treponema rectale]MBB5219308.1 4-methyl-5(b-hydroxyethyl)-thiazole monophosphate biosynthesis [Treponema rectale]QOS40807.1 DJ-1/PfpI family protein [Treponema rectale]
MNAVVFLADGFEEIEALTPVDYLRRAGVNVTVCATGTSSRTVNGAHGIQVLADMTLDAWIDSCEELPDAVVVPGGMPGAKNISECAAALALIEKTAEAGKLVCAICASPAVVLSKTSVLEGKKWTCYPDMESIAGEKACALHECKAFVHDANLITGRGPGAAEEFAMEIVKTLCGAEVYGKIKAGSVQR